MGRMLRRVLIFLVVALLTCAASLWWLHHGDLRGAVAPMLDISAEPASEEP